MNHPPEADRTLSSAFHRWSEGVSIDSLQEFLHSDSERLEALAVKRAKHTVEWASTDPEFKKMFGVEFAYNEEETALIVEASIDLRKSEYIGAMKAMSLVFWHSVLDGVVFDLCSLTAHVAPHTWDEALRDCSITLGEAKDEAYTTIRNRALEARLKKLERASLETKLDVLYDRCRTRTTWSWIKGYQFDMKRVRRIDGLRHQVIHGDGLRTTTAISDDDIEYARQTTLHLISLVAYCMEVPVDLGRIVFGEQNKPPSESSTDGS